MIVISATEFKAKCLQLLDQVSRTGERIQVTKRGKVVAELGPYGDGGRSHALPGFAKGKIRILGDIISPIEDVPWEYDHGR